MTTVAGSHNKVISHRYIMIHLFFAPTVCYPLIRDYVNVVAGETRTRPRAQQLYSSHNSLSRKKGLGTRFERSSSAALVRHVARCSLLFPGKGWAFVLQCYRS
jgi:hypothetical protein